MNDADVSVNISKNKQLLVEEIRVMALF